MNLYAHHQRVWKILYFILTPFIKLKFNIDFEQIKVEGPIVLVTNHTCTWDPLLIACALKHKQVYFVASEHIFRLGFVSKVINWLVGPIPRKKGASGKDATKKCLEQLHNGHSICLFAEGEQTWDGLSNKVIRGTGQLIKDSNATLVNYQMIGSYLSLPRYADKARKGKVVGRVAGVYSPEELKDKSAEEINEIMNRDIFVDTWKYQEEHKTKFKSNKKAEYLERMLYLCPKCLNVSTLKSCGNKLTCTCGLDLSIDEYCFFDPQEPFKTVAEWERWQKEKLRNLEFNKYNDEILFKEDNATLKEILPDHSSKDIDSGELMISLDKIFIGKNEFRLEDISKMAMTRFGVLLFTYNDHYYQIRLEGNVNLRKYLEIWKKNHNKE